MKLERVADGERRLTARDHVRQVPVWTRAATQALSQAAGSVRMIAASTPLNFRAELDRLGAAWRGGQRVAPSFAYARGPDHGALRGALDAMAGMLEGEGPLGTLYAARARELAVEAELCEVAGTPALWAAARRRFGRRDLHDTRADELAVSWLAAPRPEPSNELVRSDDDGDGRSLVSRMRQELGARRLPLRLIVSRDLASLAATGDGAVQVVAGRWLSAVDVERTVLHEIDGHVLPRLAAGSAPLGLFAVGTAHGSDEQEGRALALERASGFLDEGRRRELALRHVAARSVERRAEYVDTAELLLDFDAPVDDALRIAARAHRGGGLAREAVYLPALLRFESAVAEQPAVRDVMSRGRVSVEAAVVLAAFC